MNTREIKFRAWDGRKMMTTFVVGSLDGSVWGWDAQHQGYLEPSKKKYILMQFTGLKDKNGKEIYEGDIVEVRIPEDYGGEIQEDGKLQYLCTQEVKVSKSSGGYYTDEDTGEYCPGLGSDEIEVEIIGNIYENPELIK